MSSARRPSLLPAGRSIYDHDLMMLLLGRRLSARLRNLAVIGAHRFQERGMIDWIFPGLQQIVLFEPLDEPRSELDRIATEDCRVKVYPYAISDEDGEAQFLISSNDGESSSLKPFGRHVEVFPDVKMNASRTVQCRRLDTVVRAEQLQAPDFLLVDVQGAEFEVLSALGADVRRHVRLIYTEVSIEALYQGGRPLGDVEALLAPEFVNLGFAALMPQSPTHGNAIFVRAEDVDDALRFTTKGWLRRASRLWRNRI